jgi:RHS repeat-associated protein
VSDTATGTTNYSYDAVGNLLGAAYPNGISNTHTYNSRNQLTNLAAAKGSTPVAGYSYTLDPTGRRLSVADLGGRAATYTYDNTYRLTAETVTGAPSGPNGAVSYTYDAVGNRLQTTSTLAGVAAGAFTYDADDRLTSDTYDADGNTTSSGGIADVYDFENRLVQHGAVTVVYDGDGSRVSKTAGGVTTKYLVVDMNPTGFPQVLEESGSDGSTRKLVYGLQRISQRQSVGSTTLTSFYIYDGHGSVRALTDASGTVTDTYDYDAFGNLIHKTGSTPNEFLFAGEQFDADLGMYYNRARYLKPSTGRFFTMDTVDGDPQSPITLHKYLYGNGDPVDGLDPSGHDDLSTTMVSIGLNTTLNLTISLGFSMLFGNPGTLVAEHLLPPGFLTFATTHLPDALLAGVGGTLTGDPSETGEGVFGLNASAGFDAVIGWVNWAVYVYGGLGISLGPTSNGGSVSLYAGALWHTKNSGDYEKWFKNYSIPLTTLGAKGQKLVAAYMSASQLVSKFTGKVYKAQVIRAVDYITQGLSKVQNCTLTFFFDPTQYDGSMGVSIAFSPSSIGSSSNFAFSFSYFKQIAPQSYVTISSRKDN